MTFNKWTLALAAAGVVSLGSVAQAEEAQHSVLTALSSTTLSGYVDTSAIWRVGTRAGHLPGRSFDNGERQDGFNLHVVNLKLEKPLDEGQWSAGYKVDLLFGPDASYYGTNPLGGMNSGDFNVKQAYAAFRVPAGNGIDVRMGVFDTVIGYEVFESPNNPNFSRSYGFYLEPTHHTGVLASYQISDLISVSAGIAETAFGAINERAGRGGVDVSDSQKSYLGSITLTLPEAAGILAGSSIYAGVVDGLGGNMTGGNTKRTTSLYAGTTLATPIAGLALGGAFDYRADGQNQLNPGDNWAWASALYASFQATEQVRLNLRGEVTRGSAGTYHVGSPYYVSGDKDELFALTATIDYSLWAGLITRLEARWDRSFGGDDIAPNATSSWAQKNAVLLALNMVYKF
jgi:hypothetical protein